MSRIEKLKNRLFEKPREIYLERAVLYKEAYEKTEGEPVIIRRAKALENILSKMEIAIFDGELIVGGRSPKPRMGVVSPEMDVEWFCEELDTISTRPQDRFEITEQDKLVFKNTLYQYWKGRTLKDKVRELLPEHVSKELPRKVFKLNQTDKGQGHIIPGYERVLKIGLSGLVKQVEKRSGGTCGTGADFYKAALITLKAARDFILRYADLALELSRKADSPERRRELEEIAAICRKVSSEPPDTFHEALQVFWLLNVVFQCESNASSISPGRFDQYMYPFYERDIKTGRLTRERALELLECLWIKFNEVVALRSAESARHFAGFPIGYNIVLGGIDEEGRDATNELSYLCLKATEDVRLPQPNIGIRIHSRSPHAFLRRAAEVIRIGTGMPQVFNDEVVIPAYLNRGVTLEDARNYAVVGCVELSIPGKTYGLHDIALFNLMKVLEETLRGDFNSFDELMKDYKKRIAEGVKLMVEGSNAVDRAHREIAPTPFLSLFIDDCLERGLDVTEGGARYNFSGVQGIGTANVADSLQVIKKVVFEWQKLDFGKLKEILKADYRGYENWQKFFISRVEKYGNDIDEVDMLASEVLRFYCKEVEKYKNIRGGYFQPGSYTVSAHIPLGADVGATPDGRNAGEQLADGGLSPMVGRDRKGPTAVLKSVGKLDSYLLSNGSLLNQKFHPSALEGEDGIEKFVAYLRVFSALKIIHVQFNVISADTLRDAQKNPDQYRNLVVRVAGYSAFFTELDEAIQEDIIRRTEHGI
ncbi:formate C-acetyltransferase/glycerol dehydratase family glycyl radical enzyme [Thermoanaerobacterium sp. DL9XJH110]|uniref:formate C-acetyltransferase/glycerol dehydratase family glycyl radical enzyme n=1 Tax=Thermoanaerobacterium sp. DL9XJH110 TaxID=3386643 RepID=UPI003BB7E6EB